MVADFQDKFEKIYRRYFNDVFLFLKKLSKDEGLAEEITSETFFKAMRSIDAFRGDTDIRVWLCQIAKN
ncbi:RNA polymerase sigma factor, partial [Acutalibacter muris]|uniref:RNA polymerase sigma factor n=1 Tax=Acutalibacter muris TaxID=1796620 RepID=UPI0026F3F00B